MLSSLRRLSLSRKRGSEALEDSPAPTPPQIQTPEPEPKPTVSSKSTPKGTPKSAPGSPSRKPKSRAKPRSSIQQLKPEAPPDTPEVAAQKRLQALVKSLPPKSFHSAIASRLQEANPDQVAVLTQLLEGVEPPALLHCARCHSDYYDEENYERSCVMDHDDDSTEVKHGETTWGCCANTVRGPETPLGWCYEGKHTVCVSSLTVKTL